MHCWFFDKKDLRLTPSVQGGLDQDTEARYRREGARFIIDAGTKLGLRYDTYATGVIFFHRFYMFHTFAEFPRHVIGAACLFLAGKVEETPKKCKDVVKICRTLLTDQQFALFKDNPREEIMTSERVLLQTLKFDLQIEHPYSHVVRMAKLISGDKQKLQQVVQMAWTFINDSLCTTLCLQWEAEIIAASMLYFSTRLSKFEVTDWVGRTPGSKTKWWEILVEGLCQELIEDICHQVLDLYSSSKSGEAGQESPQPPTQTAPSDSSEGPTPKKQQKTDQPPQQQQRPKAVQPISSTVDTKPQQTGKSIQTTTSYQHIPTTYSGPNYQQDTSSVTASGVPAHYSQNNPYVSSQMYSSSFMTGEASHTIQSLIDDRDSKVAAAPQHSSYQQPTRYQPSYHHDAPPKNQATNVPFQTSQYAYHQRDSSSYSSNYNAAPYHHQPTQQSHIMQPYRHAHQYRQPPQSNPNSGLPTVRITDRR